MSDSERTVAWDRVVKCFVCDKPILRTCENSQMMSLAIAEWPPEMCDAALRRVVMVRIDNKYRRFCSVCDRNYKRRKKIDHLH